MRRRSLLAAIVAATGCGTTKGGPVYEEGVDLATARRVHAARGDDLDRDYPGSLGHGVGVVVRDPGRADGRVYGIVVYLRSERDRPPGRRFVDGVPVAFTVTGEIQATS